MRRVVTDDGLEVVFRGTRVLVEQMAAGKVKKRLIDFAQHPYCDAILAYLVATSPEDAGGTVAERCGVLQRFGWWVTTIDRSVTPGGLPPLSADLAVRFFTWLRDAPRPERRGRARADDNGAQVGKRSRKRDAVVDLRASRDAVDSAATDAHEPRRYTEVVAGAYASMFGSFCMYAAESGLHGCTLQAVEQMRDAAEQLFRGATARGARRSIEEAVAGREYVGLLHAVALDIEACRAHLEAAAEPLTVRPNGVQPFTAFSILAAARHAIRAAELNVMNEEDLQLETMTLAVHAPNKEPGEVAVDAVFVEAWELCVTWSAETRARTAHPSLLQYRDREGVPRILDSAQLNRDFLPEFYRRYFERQVPIDHDNESVGPVLAQYGTDGEPVGRFDCSYAKLRHAAIRHFASSERNIELARIFARHRRRSTTEGFYLWANRLDRAEVVAQALREDAPLLRIRLRNTVVTRMSPDLAAIERAGGATPNGTCTDHGVGTTGVEASTVPPAAPSVHPGATPKANGCRRAQDCLECKLLRLHAWKRAALVTERDLRLAQAARLYEQGFTRDAQNKIQRATLLTAHITRIDDVTGGPDVYVEVQPDGSESTEDAA